MHKFFTVLEGLPPETLTFATHIIEAMAHRVVDDTDMESDGDPQIEEAITATRHLMLKQGVAFDNHYTVEARRVVLRNDSDTGNAVEAARVVQLLLKHAEDKRQVPIEYAVVDLDLPDVSIGALVIDRKAIARVDGSLLVEKGREILSGII